MRRPKRFNLVNGVEGFHLVPGYKGQPILYLRPNDELNTHHWIEGRGKLKRLIKWLQKIERYQNV